MQELRISLNSTNRPDVIAVTECKPKHLEDPVLESEFNLEGYTSYCQGLDGKNNRGLLLYVNSNIVASVVDIPVAFQESIFVMLKDRKNINKLSIGDINRNPKSCRENDNSWYELLKYVQKQFKVPKLIVGDFNFGNIRWHQDRGDGVNLWTIWQWT